MTLKDQVAGDDRTRPAVATPAMQICRRLLSQPHVDHLEHFFQGRPSRGASIGQRHGQALDDNLALEGQLL